MINEFQEYDWSVEGERTRLENRKSMLKVQEKQLDDAFQVVEIKKGNSLQ